MESFVKIPVQDAGWLNDELAGCKFKDERLGKRLNSLIRQMWNGVGKSIPFSCEDWASTKAAYRFFSNPRINEKDILAGHFQATAERFEKTDGPILVLHDTTELSYKREDPNLIGFIKSLSNGKTLFGEPRKITTCGILMHASMAITTEGLPLGLSAIKFWTRDKFKGTNALKKNINPTRMPIAGKESYRWIENLSQSTHLLNNSSRCVHIGDRESDIYELYCSARDLGTHFLVRTCVDRLAEDGNSTIAEEMKKPTIEGKHQIEIEHNKRKKIKINLSVKFKKIKVLPPIGKQNKYPDLVLYVIHAEEKKSPVNREKISWKLITDLSINTLEEAIEKINW